MTETEAPHRSVSQLQTFISCGEAYRLEKVEKKQGLPAFWFPQGQAFHAAVEAYEYLEHDISIEDLRVVYEETWDREVTEYRLVEPDVDRWMTGTKKLGSLDSKERRAKGWQQVLGYVEWSKLQVSHLVDKLPSGEPAVEVPFKISLGGVEVWGHIDAILTGGRVRDYKTGNKMPENEYQLAVYGVAAAEIMDRPYTTGDWYYAKYNNTLPPVDLTRYSRAMLGDLFSSLDRGIANSAFIPQPGSLCRVCGVSQWCRVKGGE